MHRLYPSNSGKLSLVEIAVLNRYWGALISRGTALRVFWYWRTGSALLQHACAAFAKRPETFSSSLMTIISWMLIFSKRRSALPSRRPFFGVLEWTMSSGV